jgi:Flp pilus assembly protein TadG
MQVGIRHDAPPARVRRERRGNAMVVGLSVFVLLGFSALALDIGMIQVAETELQAAIDNAALSGASELDSTVSGIARAKARAVSVAAAHQVLGDGVTISTADVEVGNWEDGVWTAWDGEAEDAEDINAVRIDHTPPQIGTLLGSVAFPGLGLTGYDIDARAMATRPFGVGVAKSSNCFLPFAVPDCWLDVAAALGTNPPPLKFTMYPSPTDAIAWGDPTANPSASEVNNQLSNGCEEGTIEVGEDMYVNEGVQATSLQLIGNILNERTAVEPSTWDEELYGEFFTTDERDGGDNTANLVWPLGSDVRWWNWGNVLEGPIALVDGGDDCENVSFTGTLDITGVAWGVLYDVKDHAYDKNIYLQLDVENEHQI